MSDVEITRDGPVLTITLNRPDVLNALNRSVHDGIYAGLEQAKDPSVRVVVITGAGRGFCVGQDLQEFSSGAGNVADNLRENYHRNVLAIRALEKPVIAAVNGPAAGAGISLAFACDVRIASDAASFVPAFVNIGLVPDSGGTWLVRRVLGTTRAFEWLSTGRRLPADEARQWGVVSEVVPAAELAERTKEVAELFAAMPTRAVWETKRLLDTAETATFEEQLELEATTQAELTQTFDFGEGVAAFLEKREPAFTGAAVVRAHPIHLVVTDDLKRWRLTVALRWLLAVPHLLVLPVWLLIAVPVGIVNWFITLTRGRPSTGVHAWTSRLIRYQVHVNAYVYLVADPYPSFRGWPGRYPVDLAIGPPTEQARLKTLFRIVLVIPAYVFAYVLSYVVSIVGFLGLFYALATGRYPRGFRDLSTYGLRFQAQTFGYLFLLTDKYPTLANT
ncbi:MAG: 2-(1,2-epoxy,2-dihydrophenyl)acetyl-CoA isomerase [Gaiellaceae bacterium]|nr:2-(1,2-epoxy,2-dihydrophenyl)acetyl-CoA isomerase [Gaiellaceae bacterium]